MKTYKELTIHEKINVRHNSKFHYPAFSKFTRSAMHVNYPDDLAVAHLFRGYIFLTDHFSRAIRKDVTEKAKQYENIMAGV